MFNVIEIMQNVANTIVCGSRVREKAFEFIRSSPEIQEKFIEFAGEKFWQEILEKFPVKTLIE